MSSLIASIAPNPIGERATVTLAVPEGARRVRARVFDTRGSLVATVHDGPLPAGSRTLAIVPAAHGIRPGAAFLRVDVDEATETRSITVLGP